MGQVLQPFLPYSKVCCYIYSVAVNVLFSLALTTSLFQLASEWCAAEAGGKPVVINLSFATPVETEAGKAVYQRLYDEGVLIVAAAGNQGNSNLQYPAAHDSVISVASVDDRSKHSKFSQSNDQVELSAPGENIHVLQAETNRIAVKLGTSLATPFVAGLAARVWTASPRCNNKTIRQALRNTARRLGNGVPNRDYGYGLIQARDARDLLVTSNCIVGVPTQAPTKPPTRRPTRTPTTPAPTRPPTTLAPSTLPPVTSRSPISNFVWGASTYLTTNQVIYENNRIDLKPGNTALYLQQQDDGNLVLFNEFNQVYWASGVVHGYSSKEYWSILQSDGNLVTYSRINGGPQQVEWASNSMSAIENYTLILKPSHDGLLIVRRNGEIIWST
eukprot:CAMPEP_0113632132 /NCGR_PEP_ID=MMETSP0017_2-20120614/16698_1 /TAXON_ID=2856 /ORGANISM="Cylindrotheca closterium" /LENGTH=387 /DNA_ID=CAMNT_0000542669 /DNA_START=508 /DNA_END=1671 /DNA_ORIENTATION=- /assembly_acc=CAM_ASM_000147